MSCRRLLARGLRRSHSALEARLDTFIYGPHQCTHAAGRTLDPLREGRDRRSWNTASTALIALVLATPWITSMPWTSRCDHPTDGSSSDDPSPPCRPGPSPPPGTAPYATAKWRIYTDRALRAAQSSPPDYQTALTLLRTALNHAIDGFGRADPHVAAAKQNLAELLRLCAQSPDDPLLSEAIALYADALKILVDAYGHTDARVGALLHNMAGVYVRKEDWAEAERCYEEALFVKQRVFGGGGDGHGEQASGGTEQGWITHRDVQLTLRHLKAVKARRRRAHTHTHADGGGEDERKG
jgi:tetratricopeptide (TPR) repeat protein